MLDRPQRSAKPCLMYDYYKAMTHVDVLIKIISNNH